MEPTERIFVAIDTTDTDHARALADQVRGRVGGIKLGKEFFMANGPADVGRVVGGDRLFLDLKFHDIPNTVAGAVHAVLPLKPFLLNVHASGGAAMMRAAAQAAADAGEARPLMLGVTLLTSLGDEDLAAIGVDGTAADQVVRLAKLAQACGMDGVVCSAREIEVLRETCGDDFKLVVPGIRPSWASADDQKRVVTPRIAIERGADYLVIGRPITAAADPAGAAGRIADELA